MGSTPKVLVVLGTRPEAVKLYPVIRAFRDDGRAEVVVATTGQHREMVDDILGPLGITPDHDLDIMRPDQTLNDIVCRVLPPIEKLYRELSPRMVLVQGDTTTAFCAGLAAFHSRVAVGHVEAGLRSFDRFHPYPEEANRRMLSCVADLHLAATPHAAENLFREGIRREDVVVTGNPVVDSLLDVVSRPELLESRRSPDVPRKEGERIVLITLHRRESWMKEGEASETSPLERVLEAVATAASEYPETTFVYPVHRNPRVQEPARRILSGRSNIQLLNPVPYLPFVDLMSRAKVILTDSGGIQEEAPSLGVPVLVARETTERPEAVEAGVSCLVGTDPKRVLSELRRRLGSSPDSSGSPSGSNPYGDGKAGERIRSAVLHRLGMAERTPEFEPVRTSAPPGGTP